MQNDSDKFVRGSLFAGAWRGEAEKVRRVLNDHPSLVNAVDDNGVSALRFAAQFGHEDICHFLLDEFGADLSLKALDGIDALAAAAQQGHSEIVHLLLEKGAKPRPLAIEAALEKGHTEICAELRAAGAKPRSAARRQIDEKCAVS